MLQFTHARSCSPALKALCGLERDTLPLDLGKTGSPHGLVRGVSLAVLRLR